jgi:hypothetical protein
MILPGRLSLAPLGDVLGALHRARVHGVLELVERVPPSGGAHPGRRHHVHLALGLVARVESALPVPPLGEWLAGREGAPRDARARLGRALALDATRLAGELAVELGLASPADVALALRAQLRARLDALFSLPDATVRFHVARPALRARGPVLLPSDFLHGRPRARDVQASPRAGAAAPRREAQGTARARPEPRGREHALSRSSALGLLGLTGDPTPDEVRRAFRRRASEVHPDRAVGEQGADRTRALAALSAAYHTLID